jgi:hypothetical protein
MRTLRKERDDIASLSANRHAELEQLRSRLRQIDPSLPSSHTPPATPPAAHSHSSSSPMVTYPSSFVCCTFVC